MDFFEQQHRARRRTALMVLLFTLAVVAIVVVLDLVGACVYAVLINQRILLRSSNWLLNVPTRVYVWTTVSILFVIGWGTLSRLDELSGGGVAVAKMVGARLLKWNADDPQERRLLNIVEEMALASGIGVPRACVMDSERSINAFAAGFSPNEATVIVTRGALESLNRDELQGVVAHEFSHILNGDMRLNVQLLGVIAGIVIIGSAGAVLLRGLRWSNLVRSSREAQDVYVWLVPVGLALWLIGSIGVLAGRVMKAVVSREREFLADASAVQFTRNPEGIGGALFKIGEKGSIIFDLHAEELSHMCINTPNNDYFEFSLFHTHPPLDERIERLLGPGAKRLLRERTERAEAAALAAQESPVVPELASPLYALRGRASAAAAGAGATVAAQAMVASVGNPNAAHVDYARRLLDAIPAEIRTAMQNEDGARAALFSLLLGQGEIRGHQLSIIGKEYGEELAARSAGFTDVLAPLGAKVRLPLLELAVPALKALPRSEREKLLGTIQALIEADHKVTLAEFVLQTLCRRHFREAERSAPPIKHKGFASVAPNVEVVLSLLAHAGNGGAEAFDKGMAALGTLGGALYPPSELKLPVVEAALKELNLLAPLKKPLFIRACVATAMADDKLTLAEGELLRAICAALDSPVPPILETTEAVA